MKLRVTNESEHDVVLHLSDGRQVTLKPGESETQDRELIFAHHPGVARRAQHGLADAAGITSHSGTGQPYSLELRLAQALDKLGKAVRGE